MIVGFAVDDADLDDLTNSSGVDSIDPFDFVYSNLPDSTHVLKSRTADIARPRSLSTRLAVSAVGMGISSWLNQNLSRS